MLTCLTCAVILMLVILVAEIADKDDRLFTVFAERSGENRLKALDKLITVFEKR